MINCIAVDDEPLALTLLADNISKINYLNLNTTCDDAISANNALQEGNVDLIFTDIQMPGISGIQFIKSIVNKPLIIVVSAYKQYAVEGFDLDIVDYLVKPVSLDRFMKACNKAKDLLELRSLKNSPEAQSPDHVFLNAGYNLIKIVYGEVSFVEGLRDYVKIHFSDNRKPAIIRISFKNIEGNWPSFFKRVHKSFIVNTKQITSVSKTNIVINESELPLGKSYQELIMKLIEESGSLG